MGALKVVSPSLLRGPRSPGKESDSIDHRKEREPGALTIPGLAKAFGAAQKSLGRRAPQPLLDILGMDSCLMSTAEVCDEVHVTSAISWRLRLRPERGWPYRFLVDISRRHLRSSAFPPGELCSWVVTLHRIPSEYLPAGVSVDIAACDLPTSMASQREELVDLLCRN